MLLTQKKFYLLNGIRKPTDLVSKDPASMGGFGFPKDSIYHYIDTSDTDIIHPDVSVFYLDFDTIIRMRNSEFIEDVDSIQLLPAKRNTVIATIQKDKRVKLDLRDSTVITSSRVPVIMNHQSLLHLGRPKVGKKVYHWDYWNDIYKTMFLNININPYSSRKGYIFIDNIVNIPSISTIKNKLLNEENSKRLDMLVTNDSTRLLLSIWKWGLGSDSVLSTLTESSLTNTNIVVRNKSSFLVLNLGTLRDWLDDKKTVDITLKKLTALFIRMSTDRSVIEAIDEVQEVDEDNITDKILRVNALNTISVTNGDEVDTSPPVDVNKLVYEDNSDVDIIKSKMSKYDSTGILNKVNNKKILNILEKQDTVKSPFSSDGRSLKEDLTITEEELTLSDEDISLPVDDTLLDKTMATDIVGSMDKKYSKIMHKDIARSMYAIQKTGVVIEDIKIEDESSITGDSLIYSIKLRPIYGKVSTIKVRMPKVTEEGEFTISGSTYRMRKLRTDVPIRKIDSNIVSLTTYYGRLFITRSTYRRHDSGYWLASNILKLSGTDDSNIESALSGDVSVNIPGLPLKYTNIGKYLKSFKVGSYSFNFNYNNREELLTTEDIKDVEIKNSILVGTKGKAPLVMNKTGDIFTVQERKLIAHDSIETITGIDKNKDPGTPTHMKLLGNNIAIGLILSYFIGITKLFKLLDMKYETHLPRATIEDQDSKIVIKFSNMKISFKRTYDYKYNILSSLSTVKELSSMNFDDLDNRDSYTSLLQGNTIRKLDVLETSFIDPISLDILKSMKEPTTFKGLLIRSAELLETDYHPDPQDMDHMLIKGYERFGGLLYKHLINSVEDFNRRNVFGNSAVNADPYGMYNVIKTDSSISMVEDLNPIGTLKQQEDVTYVGTGGRSKETMSKKTRFLGVNDIGITSELSKDSGDVGISAYLSASPNIRNIRGLKDHDLNIDTDGSSSVFSTSAMLSPGAENDDMKRVFFSGIQDSHTVPIVGQEQPKVRTGYDYVLPYRAGSKYVFIADEDGEVKSKSKNKIVCEYTTGKKISKKLSDKNFSRPIADMAYVQNIGTLLNKGDTFKKGDIITFNTNFFERDWFYPDRIVYKNSTTAMVAFAETNSTYEDSHVVTKSGREKVVTTIVKVSSNVIKTDMMLSNVVSVGDEIEAGDTLFIASEVFNDTSGLSSDTIKNLQDNTKLAINSKYKGTVVLIECFYNSDDDTTSKSISKFISETNDAMSIAHNKKVTGKVTGEYSVNGTSMKPGTMEIKVYVRNEEPFGTGDKIVIGNQLKTTASEVSQVDISTEDGTGIDFVFGDRSQYARIVLSTMLIGSTNILLDAVAKEAVSRFEN